MKQKSKLNPYRAIIPCSGKGTRMGRPKDGKEMLTDPVTKKPLVYWSIMKALRSGWLPIVILNSKKTKLKNYLSKEFGRKIRIVFHDPQPWEEWPHSVLSSQKYWGKWNILLLPDTRFPNPLDYLKGAKQVKKVDLLFFTHKVDDGSKFGVVFPPQDGIIYTVEKPRSLEGKPASAWGLIGFTKDTGALLFRSYAVRNMRLGLHTSKFNINGTSLKWFKDITRTGVLERYEND